MKQILLEEIGRLIKIKRYDLEMTQTKLQKLTKISFTNLASIEQGKSNTTIHTLFRIAKALNCDIADILPKELK